MGAQDAKPRETTLLDLLSELQDGQPTSEKALVAVALHMIRSGRVILNGTYRGRVRIFG